MSPRPFAQRGMLALLLALSPAAATIAAVVPGEANPETPTFITPIERFQREHPGSGLYMLPGELRGSGLRQELLLGRNADRDRRAVPARARGPLRRLGGRSGPRGTVRRSTLRAADPLGRGCRRLPLLRRLLRPEGARGAGPHRRAEAARPQRAGLPARAGCGRRASGRRRGPRTRRRREAPAGASRAGLRDAGARPVPRRRRCPASRA